MGLYTTCNRLKKFLLTLFILSLCSSVYGAAIRGLEEGSAVAYCKQINFTGASQTLTASGLNCTLDSTAGAGGGDISAVGDCASGDCFEGTAGNTITNTSGADLNFVTAGSDEITFTPTNLAVTIAASGNTLHQNTVITTGKNFTIGSTQWNSGDSIDGEQIANDTIDDDSIDFVDVTCADITMTDCGNITVSSGAVNLDGGSLELPQDDTTDAVGECQIDTTDFTLVCHDGTANRVMAHDEYPCFGGYIEDDGDYTDDVIFLGRAPRDFAVTLIQVTAVSYGNTLGYYLEERAYASEGSTGTRIMDEEQQVDTNGEKETTFTNAGLAADSGIYFVGATDGGATGVSFTGYCRKDVE